MGGEEEEGRGVIPREKRRMMEEGDHSDTQVGYVPEGATKLNRK
jgi:hypothetical protein